MTGKYSFTSTTLVFQHRIHYHRTAIRLLRPEISIHYTVHLTETDD